MTHKLIALIVAVGAAILGFSFIFLGSTMLKNWNLQVTDSSLVVARRLGAIYFGLSTLLFLSRTNFPTSQAIAIGMAVSCGLLACLGLYELSQGRVSKGILVSVSVEALLAIAFITSLSKS
jgi:hypothetical protein